VTKNRPTPKTLSEIQRIEYAPPSSCDLDLEVISFAELKTRAPLAALAMPLCMNFYHFIGITTGHCRHIIDFTPHDCQVGTWILVRPGQLQSFDILSRWNGVMVLFKPEFLLPLLSSNAELKIYGELDQFPNVISLNATEHKNCISCITHIKKDAQLDESIDVRHALLRHQLYSVLLRFNIALKNKRASAETSVNSLQRLKRFQQLVDMHFSEWHLVSDYTNLIGCSTKTLNRTTLEVMGICAKSFLSQRITLEAKRLLAHTDAPISTISAQLGFDETTNFVKFFKREANCIPTEFRRQQKAR